MEPKKLPVNVADKLREWMGGEHSVLQVWESEGSHYILANTPRNRTSVYCIRIFPIGSELALSQDNILYLGS